MLLLVTRISNRREGAAADGDGSTVITEVYIAERAACDVSAYRR